MCYSSNYQSASIGLVSGDSVLMINLQCYRSNWTSFLVFILFIPQAPGLLRVDASLKLCPSRVYQSAPRSTMIKKPPGSRLGVASLAILIRLAAPNHIQQRALRWSRMHPLLPSAVWMATNTYQSRSNSHSALNLSSACTLLLVISHPLVSKATQTASATAPNYL